MSDAVSLVVARLTVDPAFADGEEGFRAFPYDDRTGKQVKAPAGNITVGYGCNLSAGISRSVAKALLQAQVAEIVPQLNAYPWYDTLDPVRQSVLLDVAFNAGIGGLLEFKQMIGALAAKNWSGAAAQLLASKVAINDAPRYGPLADLLRSGGTSDV